jgi:anti-sigma factor RsiW
MTCDLHDHDRCRALFERLSDYIDGDMEPDQRPDFEAHLAECLGCHDCLQALQRTISICRRTGGQPVPAALSERLAHCFPDPA